MIRRWFSVNAKSDGSYAHDPGGRYAGDPASGPISSEAGLFSFAVNGFFDLSDDCLSGIMEKGKRHL